ncbi:MAG: YfiR family protein [Vicinamibacterales bacterium]
MTLPLSAVAQDVTEPALKAAFIYNFVRFTEWPDVLAASAPFVICVPGDAAVGDELERTVKGRELAGHRIVVSQSPAADQKRECHALYLSGVRANQAAQLISGLRDIPVLTISDIDGFTAVGGIVQFFFERGRLRFGIRIESAQQARLKISSKLLVLAKRYE